jgi:ABC-type antimicrobial peptide transport system permease subunit
VLGASVGDIIRLLSKEHLKLIAIANIVALPLGYFAMRAFLQNYPFRASLAAVFVIAFLTVFYQTFKAARANPADTLKFE